MNDDTVTITLAVPRDAVEIVLALAGWLRYRDEEPLMLAGRALPSRLIHDNPFIAGMPPLCDEVAEAALFYVRHIEPRGGALAAFAAYEDERRNLSNDKVRRFFEERGEAEP